MITGFGVTGHHKKNDDSDNNLDNPRQDIVIQVYEDPLKAHKTDAQLIFQIYSFQSYIACLQSRYYFYISCDPASPK